MANKRDRTLSTQGKRHGTQLDHRQHIDDEEILSDELDSDREERSADKKRPVGNSEISVESRLEARSTRTKQFLENARPLGKGRGGDRFDDDNDDDDDDDSAEHRQPRHQDNGGDSAVHVTASSNSGAPARRRITTADTEVIHDIFFSQSDDAAARRIKDRLLEEKGQVRYVFSEDLPSVQAADIVIRKGHRASPTCVDLVRDGSAAFTGGKDGAVLAWDVEYGKKTVFRQGECRVGRVLAVAASFDGKFVASGGVEHGIRIWDTRSQSTVTVLRGHRDSVTALSFRDGSHDLFSGSADRTVKTWNVDDFALMQTLYGHASEITGLDSLAKERCISCSRDKTARVWKVVEETQLLFESPSRVTSSIDCVAFASDTRFVTGCQNGSIFLWSTSKRKPVAEIANAHDGSWVTAVSCLRKSDVVASGAGNGQLRFYRSVEDTLSPLHTLALPGWLNAMKFSADGRFLAVAVGQEHRMGRWFLDTTAVNGLAVVPLASR